MSDEPRNSISRRTLLKIAGIGATVTTTLARLPRGILAHTPPANTPSRHPDTRRPIQSRLTEQAKLVNQLSQEQAYHFSTTPVVQIRTEHILLALLRVPDSFGARLLVFLDMPLDRVREAVLEQVTPGLQRHGRRMQFAPDGRRAIRCAIEEANSLNDRHVGTEHYLMGLVREDSGLARRVLVKLGADLDRIRQMVMAARDGEGIPV